MKRSIIALGILTTGILSTVPARAEHIVPERLDRFSFGSCNDEDDPQGLWNEVLASRAQAFFWLGDTIYADTTDVDYMAQKYLKQLSHPEYQAVKNAMLVDGIYDDHDFSSDNIGGENPIKVQAKDLFLDFIGDPSDSPRRSQPGVWESYTYGPPGQQAKLIFLDTRYNRDSPLKFWGDMLGEEQWKWLEAELKGSQAQMHFIVVGVSVISPFLLGFEGFENFPVARERLFKLLDGVPGVVFLTGDRHFAGFLKKKMHGKTYYEFLSSGFNQQLTPPERLVMKLLYGSKNSSFEHNVGLIDVDWSKAEPELTFTTLQTEAPASLHKRLRLVGGLWRLVVR